MEGMNVGANWEREMQGDKLDTSFIGGSEDAEMADYDDIIEWGLDKENEDGNEGLSWKENGAKTDEGDPFCPPFDGLATEEEHLKHPHKHKRTDGVIYDTSGMIEADSTDSRYELDLNMPDM